jgi:hypothetical protein
MPKVEKDIVLANSEVNKTPIKQLREDYIDLGEAYHILKNGAYCHECDKFLPKKSFYKSPHTTSGLIPTCKDCLYKIGTGYDPKTKETHETRETVIAAMKKADLPFIEELYESSCNAISNEASDKKRGTAYSQMITCIQSLPQYFGMTYADSDHIKIISSSGEEAIESDNDTDIKKITREKNNEIIEQYRINRKDVIHSIGYDPFENYPIEEDKPILYAQLNSFIDDETKNDGMKMGAVIQIVKKLNQAEKLNDQIDKYINDSAHAVDNMALIDKMAGSSQKLMSVANALAKDNGISVNFNNNKSKGANTLSGKIKKLNEIGLREAKINSFDIGTCEGMRQVAEISEEARHKQIGYDENIAQEIKDIKVELVEKLSKERDKAVEDSRRLLMENKDLKDYLRAKGLVDENYQIIDDN